MLLGIIHPHNLQIVERFGGNFMEQKIIKLIENFALDLSGILENSIIDIIIHGSAVTGGFIKGKGDIDFLIFTNGKISDAQKEQIFRYHRNIRMKKTLASQLEGCYYSLDQERQVIGGIYLGTSERGWKEIDQIVHNKIGMAEILSNYYSTHKSGILDEIFKFTWEEVKNELKIQSKNNLSMIDEYDDYGFKVYAIYVSARSLYTMEKKDFISKGKSLKWILEKERYHKYQELIEECSKLRNPLTQDEINEINKDKFRNIKEFLIEINSDIQRQSIR